MSKLPQPVTVQPNGLAFSNFDTTLALCQHTIAAQYTNLDGNFQPHQVGQISLTVQPAPTSVTITPSLIHPVYGQAVTLTVAVANTSGGGLTPTGSAQIKVDGTTFGPPIPLGQFGRAVLTLDSSLAAGNHVIEADYSNTDGKFANRSTSIHLSVNSAATSTVVTSSSHSAVYGQPLIYTAVVRNTTDSELVPTGSVQFVVDVRNYSAPVPLNSSGTTVCTVTGPLAIGTHAVFAMHLNNDHNFGESTSPLILQTISRANATVNLKPSTNPTNLGTPVTFTATINANQPGSGQPTGILVFTEGNITLGTITIVDGTADFTTSTLKLGNHTITAIYKGGSDFNGSRSVVTETVVNVPS